MVLITQLFTVKTYKLMLNNVNAINKYLLKP